MQVSDKPDNKLIKEIKSKNSVLYDKYSDLKNHPDKIKNNFINLKLLGFLLFFIGFIFSLNVFVGNREDGFEVLY